MHAQQFSKFSQDWPFAKLLKESTLLDWQLLYCTLCMSCVSSDLPPARGRERYLRVKELIYFDKHILEFSSKSDMSHPSSSSGWLWSFAVDVVWCVGESDIIRLFSGSLLNTWISSVGYSLKIGFQEAENTRKICDIINSLESRAWLNIQQGTGNPELWWIGCFSCWSQCCGTEASLGLETTLRGLGLGNPCS